ncbi:MAG: cupredoxin family copper-binding protein [Patescibacteria group bacterium]|nr:cupredoxin family copper-binding protein [Patescibacteria group bacterium]
MENNDQAYGYGKRPLWHWILLYAVIAVVVYAFVYYFFFANKGGYNTSSYTPTTNTTYGTQTPSAPQNSNASVPTPASSQPMSVAISNFAFSPNQISVKAGTKVTWTNNDSVAHTVTSNTGAFDSGTLNPGSAYSFTFSTPGTFSYHCRIHPNMTATVVVTQ